MANPETISICCRIVTGVLLDNGNPAVRRHLRLQRRMVGELPALLHLEVAVSSEGYRSAELRRPLGLTARAIRYADHARQFREVDCFAA